MINKLKALWHLMSPRSVENQIQKHWLLRTSSRMDRRFWSKNQTSITNGNIIGEFRKITISEKVFLWPSAAPAKTVS